MRCHVSRGRVGKKLEESNGMRVRASESREIGRYNICPECRSLIIFAAPSMGLPCCTQDDPEPLTPAARRCFQHTKIGERCTSERHRKYCPITCGVCVLCPWHPRFHEYRKFGTSFQTSWTLPKRGEGDNVLTQPPAPPSAHAPASASLELNTPSSATSTSSTSTSQQAGHLRQQSSSPSSMTDETPSSAAAATTWELAGDSAPPPRWPVHMPRFPNQTAAAEAFLRKGPGQHCVYFRRAAQIKFGYQAWCGSKQRWSDFDVRNYLQSHWHAGEPHGASCGRLTRLGADGDGGKLVCDVHSLVRAGQRCLVVSVGSNGESSFERAVHEINPHCEVHVYDHTLSAAKLSALPIKNPTRRHKKLRVQLQKGARTRADSVLTSAASTRIDLLNVEERIFRFYPERFNATSEQVRRYRGRTVQILKLDCDGCEFTALPTWLDRGICTHQVLLELHAADNGAIFGPMGILGGAGDARQRIYATHALLARMEAHELAVFSVEPNIAYSDGSNVELGLVARRPARVGCAPP